VPWPPGTKILYVGGDQMTKEMSVPLSRTDPVLPGEEVDVAVEMMSPTDLGRYLGYWRLVGPHGRRKFGQRVWCHVQVVDPSAPAAIASDDDLARTVAEIEKKKSDLAATDPDPSDPDPSDETDTAPITTTTTTEAAPAPPEKAAAPPAAELVAPPPSDEAAADGHTSDDGFLITESMAIDASDPDAPTTVEGEAFEPITHPSTTSASKSTSASSPSSSSPSSSASASSAVIVQSTDASPNTADGVKAALASMGFTDAYMVDKVIAKCGPDLDACARDLVAASEWDSLLDDLAEMGFTNRERNKTLMLKHNGNVKRTVRELVEDA